MSGEDWRVYDRRKAYSIDEIQDRIYAWHESVIQSYIEMSPFATADRTPDGPPIVLQIMLEDLVKAARRKVPV